ncbi:MAG: hypothetical protein RI894_1003 [Bacteroidota bacterium]|jgi:hypothetical protein
MKKIIIFCAIALTSALSFTSCQKVIDVDLNTAAPQYVIEGFLHAGTDTFKVHIAQTSSYFAAENASTINAATVTLLQDNGSPISLQSIGNGNYIAPNYTAQSDHNYTLKVVDNGKTFIAAAYMPRLVRPDTVEVSTPSFVPPNPGGGGSNSKKTYVVISRYKDPAGVANYYQVRLSPESNGGRSTYYLANDKNVDGAPNSITIVGSYLPNTPATLEFICLDKSTYNYFNQLEEIIGRSSNSVSPANPDNNWSNGALGYFGASNSVKIPILIR